jgi:VacB/RNase II family 3'-5' exoribonuclease
VLPPHADGTLIFSAALDAGGAMHGRPGIQRQQLQKIARQAMLDRGFEPDFPSAAQAQAAKLTAPAAADQGLPDLRQMLWASIDNDDSRDLDQLSVGAALPDGATRVLVAVADVDALVSKASPLDLHASHNTTSVYTAAQIFPMLPEKLSTDLSSLGEAVDRVAVVIDMEIDGAGSCTRSTVYRALVRNQAKLAYHSVGAWLEGHAAPPPRVAAVKGLDEQLRLQDAAAQRLRHRRFEQGALTLQTIETRPVFDGDTLTALVPEEPDRAKALIEDFMITANTAIARFLDERHSPSVRRIVRTPKRWPRIVEVAASYGWKLPPDPDAAALSEFLVDQHRKDPTRFPDLSLTVIKLLGSGEYIVEPPGGQDPGHFGLAVRDYTHSTAPNRRYPDVITQRLVKAALAGTPPPYPLAALEELAAHCTQMEDEAQRVERQVAKSAAAMLLSSRIGQSFAGIVTGASDKGTYVRIFDPPTEGRVIHGGAGLDVGEKVKVRLVGTDVDRGWIDFEV